MPQYSKSSYTLLYKPSAQISVYYKKNIKLNKQLCKVHLECALVWRYSWQLIQSFIDEKLKRQFEIRYDDLNKTSTVSNLNNNSVLRLFK